MELKDMPPEDLAQIKEILESWRAEGNDNPMLAMNVDFDGDGTADAIGLDENGDLVIINSVDVEETVYESEGDDVAGPDASREGGE